MGRGEREPDYSYDVKLDDESSARVRRPTVVGILASLTPYGWYWYYAINRDLRDLGRSRIEESLDVNPWVAVLANSIGFCLLVPWAISWRGTVKRIQRAQALRDTPMRLSGWLVLGLLLVIVISAAAGISNSAAIFWGSWIPFLIAGFILYRHLQLNMNSIWKGLPRITWADKSSVKELGDL